MVMVKALYLILANLLDCPFCAEISSNDFSENNLGVFLALLLNYLNYHLAMSLGLFLKDDYIPVHHHSARRLIDSL